MGTLEHSARIVRAVGEDVLRWLLNTYETLIAEYGLPVEMIWGVEPQTTNPEYDIWCTERVGKSEGEGSRVGS